ncbi:MAG: NAD(P)H-binding protein [Haloarculaceae archaeon]
MDRRRVLVAGASGGTGRAVLDVFAHTDWRVRAVTRSESTADWLDGRADEVVVADLMNPRGAARAAADVDAVVTTVGSTPAQVLRASEFVDGTGNVHLVDAALAAGAETFVMESSLGVGGDRASWLARVFGVAIEPVLAAKAEAEAALRESGLTYTVLRPGVLVGDWARGDVEVAAAGTGLWGVVSRHDVARLLVAALATPAAHDRTLEVVRNPLQRGAGERIDWRLPGERRP